MDDMNTIRLTTLTCQRCAHTWTPRTTKRPDVCPNPRCKSRYWDRPRKQQNPAPVPSL